MIKTNEGANQYEHSLYDALEFFSKAGSLRDKAKNQKNVKDFYSNKENIIPLFEKALNQNVEIAFKLLFWLRDRNGTGNRSGFRNCLAVAVKKYPQIIRDNINLIPLYGRWDDLRVLFGTEVERDAVKLWATAILNKDGLACKWADRSDKELLRYLRGISLVISNEATFRKYLSANRKVVEHKMCSNTWNEIEYPKVPSKAMSLYTKAFNKHDETRFSSFKEKLVKGETKVNAGAIFPHDCALTAINGDNIIADKQFEALPNYMENTKERVMVLCDSSGSMNDTISGSTKCIHVSTSLSLYCSDRIGKDNPFYRKFMQFENESKLTNWTNETFSDCYKNFGHSNRFFNGACGATRIDIALDTLLNFAQMYKITNDQIPTTLMIISDMQFTKNCRGTEETVIESCLKKWTEAGYNRPKIIYWNVNGHTGSPATKYHENVVLISGFSPSILQSVLSGENFTPIGVMLKALNKYNIVIN